MDSQWCNSDRHDCLVETGWILSCSSAVSWVDSQHTTLKYIVTVQSVYAHEYVVVVLVVISAFFTVELP